MRQNTGECGEAIIGAKRIGGMSMTISIILASQSKPRRDVLYAAGICPTIKVSHVDEPAALEQAARKIGVPVERLDVGHRVAILARAKANAVYEAYRAVADTAKAATGERVIAYPLEAEQVRTQRRADARPSAGAAACGQTSQPVSVVSSAITRDFSGITAPTRVEPIDTPISGIQGLNGPGPGPLIVGCDSMFLFDGECYGKPHDEATARERLRRMRGRSGELWTGHCVIDFATGRAVQDASRAVVYFGDYSDEDIERYIATGEPLEVAGSFTLEGFGGAFIDRIDGDPHGVIGISLPLLRRLVTKLDISWTDLWNVKPHAPNPEELDKHPDSTQPPVENVHQPGDGWVSCACGRRHWGTHGAAGILLARRNDAGKVTHVAMQHRAQWSAEGGTWGIPGGAIADNETPIEGALRESFEEANITPQDIEVVGSYREDHGPWAYTTVFAFEKPGHEVHLRANDDESMEIAWIPVDDVPNRKLLTAMRTDWQRFADRLRILSNANQGR